MAILVILHWIDRQLIEFEHEHFVRQTEGAVDAPEHVDFVLLTRASRCKLRPLQGQPGRLALVLPEPNLGPD